MSTNKSHSSDEIRIIDHDSHRFLIKSTSVISLGTLTSRIFGFLRDIILAKLLGTGSRADAFFVALKIPNLFRDLVAEGATNAAIVPVFSEYLEKKDRTAFWNFVSVIITWGLILLSAIVILGISLAPVIVRVIAPGFMADPQKLLLTIRLTQWMFPYLVFIGITAYSMGILYTFRSFTAPAFSPCLLNIAIIVSALISFKTLEEPVFGLAVGVLAGGVLQLAVQLRPLWKVGMRYRRPETLYDAGAVQIGKLMMPRIIGSGVYQLTVFIDTFCASLAAIVGQGGISAIYYANRIVQFPMGVFGVALASAVLPTLSGFASRKDIPSLKKTLVFSLENVFFVMCPVMMILMLLSTPIVRALFERGEFDVYSTQITALALSFYALGLLSFGGIKIMVTAFYALQDTKTPVKTAALCLVVNAGLNFIFMFPLKVGGIALASAVAGTLNFLILFAIMNKRLGGFDTGLLRYFGKVFLGAVLTGLAVYGGWSYVRLPNEFLKLFMTGAFGLVFYEIVCLALRVEQARKIWEWLKTAARGKKLTDF